MSTRIFYIGGEDRYSDQRLAGVVLNYGTPVDVHDDDLATELLQLRHFSLTMGPAQVVEDTPHEVPVEVFVESVVSEEAGDEAEVDHGNT